MAAIRKNKSTAVPTLPKTIITRVASGKGFYLCTYLNVWVPDHINKDGKEIGMSFSRHRKTIGLIDSEDGLGYVRLYESFLEENPSFRNYIVKRTGPSTFELTRITPGMDISMITPPKSRRSSRRKKDESLSDA